MKTQLIKYYGDLKNVVTSAGIKVRRSDFIYVPEYKGKVRCASYDNHFVYENPDKKTQGSAYLCTCGAPAVVVGYDAIKQDTSLTSAQFVCLQHAQMGKHADGSS